MLCQSEDGKMDEEIDEEEIGDEEEAEVEGSELSLAG